MSQNENFENLFIALVNCFVFIISGYVVGRLNLITSNQAKGISKLTGYIALPMLLFKNMVELDFSMVTWSLLLAVFVGKTCVFVIVFVLSLVIGRGDLGRAGLYGMFSTQSNDFAMGYPIMQVLYSGSYPELLQYIYLLAPIQLCILNPIGFAFLEIDQLYKTQNTQSIESSAGNSSDQSSTKPGGLHILKKVLLGLIQNPVVLMVFVGLIFHFIFKGTLPAALNSISTTASDAFAACALFYLGTTMVGNISSQKGPGLFTIAGLVAAKILILPILARNFMFLFGSEDLVQPGMNVTTNTTEEADYINVLADFTYLYGTIPSAPTVIIFASQYNKEVDRMATSMVVCTALSAPIMYISAWSLTYSQATMQYFQEIIIETYTDVSYVAVFCSIWCVFVLIASKKVTRIPHIITTILAIAMAWTSLMFVIMINTMDSIDNKYVGKFLFFLTYFGVTTTRFITASLAICLLMLEYKGKEYTRKYMKYLLLVPVLLGTLWGVITTVTGDHLICTLVCKQRDNPDVIVQIIMLILSFGVVCVSLLILFRKKRESKSSQASPISEESDDSRPLFENDDVIDSDVTNHQFTRHVCLLLCLMMSMLVGIVLISWQINRSFKTGSYTELTFLDSVLSVGQSIFMFFIFGFDNELIVDPIRNFFRKITGKENGMCLPNFEDLDHKTLDNCKNFVKFHLVDCRSSIETTKRISLRCFEKSFTGESLVNYLIEKNIAADKTEAISYGEDLLQGRVIRPVKNKSHFQNSETRYKFNEKKRDLHNSGSHENLDRFEFETFMRTSSVDSTHLIEKSNGNLVKNCAENLIKIADSTDE